MRSYPVLQAFILTALVAMLPAGALADDGLDGWRAKAEHVRGLAENDVPAAHKEALQLQSSLPLSASAIDRARVLNLLARIEVYLGDTGAAERHAKDAFELARKNSDRAGQAEADLNNVLIAVNQGRFDAMTESIKHSMVILADVDRTDLRIEAMLRTSMMYCRFDHFGDCIEEATQTMDMAQRGSNPLALAHACQGMAGAYDYLGRHAQARDYYQKMHRAAREAHSRLQEGDAVIGLGSVITKMGDTRSGERLIRDGIQLYRKAGGPFHVAHGQYSLAENLRKQKRLAEAQASLNETVAIYERKSNKAGLWRALNLRGANSRELGRIAEARADTDRAYMLAKATGQPLYLGESVRMQAATAAEAGDYKQAYRLSVEAELSAQQAGEQVSAHRLELARRDENRNQQRQLEEFTRSHEMQSLQNRWLWTVLAGSAALLAVSGLFLLHLRRSREAVRKLNVGLEQRVRERTAELTQSQQLLAARERELRALADSSPGMMGCFHIKANGWICIPYVSPNILVQYGLHPEDVAEDAAPFGRLCHPDDAQRLLESIAESARSMTPWHQEYRILHPTKGERWMEGHTSPQPHPDGGTIWYGYLFDITERKRMEAALVARAQEFRSLAESMPENIVRYDRDGLILYVNGRLLSQFGLYSAEELIGKRPSEVWPDGRFAQIEQAAECAVESGSRVNIELALPSGRGALSYHQICVVPERDVTGQVVGTIAFSRDVTDIREAERRLNSLVQNLPGFAFSVREVSQGAWSMPFASSGIEDIFGLKPEDVKGDFRPLQRMVHAEDWPRLKAAQAECRRTLLPLHVEFRVERSGHPERWIECRTDPNIQLNGDVLWHGIMLDITERKQAEARIHELNAELEQRVRERTTQLEAMNRELRESEQRYREIFENVTDTLYLVEVTPEKQFRNLAFNRAFEKSTGIPRNELVGQIVDRVQVEGNAMAREVARVMVARYRNCIEAGKPVETDTILDLPSGRRYYQSTLVPLRDDAGEIRRILGIAHDVTEIKRVEREFRTLAENIPDNIIRYDRDARQIFINAAAERTLGVGSHALHNLTPEETPEHIRVMTVDEYSRRVRRVLETGVSQELEVTFWHAKEGRQVHSIKFVAERDEQGTIVGTLVVGHDITALKAIENELKESRAQLRGLTAQREQAREEERKHIAREVHDELGQILTGLKLNVSILNHRLAAGQDLATGKLQETMLLTDRALEVARNVASALRPSALEMGIVPAFEWLADRFVANTGIRCNLHIDDNDMQLDEASAIALFRILQESLTNVVRHANAERVDVILRREAGDYVMKVRDNGNGFDSSRRKADSFGLVGIRERALMLGGTVDIDSCPGKGTEIVVHIPVQSIAEES